MTEDTSLANGRSSASGLPGAEDSEFERIYAEIRNGILSGKYNPGDRLVENRLAVELNVSRPKIREVLARLEGELLVSSEPNRGRIVRHLNHRDISEIFDIRAVLEAHAAGLAAQYITPKELAELRAVHEQMVALGEVPLRSEPRDEEHLKLIRHIAELNRQFHRIIFRSSRNRRLEFVVTGVMEQPLMFQSSYWSSVDDLSETVREHANIIDLLSRQESELSATAMKRHLLRSLNTLLRDIPDVR